MIWGLLVGGFALVVLLMLAVSHHIDEHAKARAAREVLNREHELALADHEVAIWKAAAESPAPSIFQHRRGMPPEFVGRSQVLSGTGRGDMPETGTMPMPKDPSMRVEDCTFGPSSEAEAEPPEEAK